LPAPPSGSTGRPRRGILVYVDIGILLLFGETFDYDMSGKLDFLSAFSGIRPTNRGSYNMRKEVVGEKCCCSLRNGETACFSDCRLGKLKTTLARTTLWIVDPQSG
jgi:hypothetical protein